MQRQGIIIIIIYLFIYLMLMVFTTLTLLIVQCIMYFQIIKIMNNVYNDFNDKTFVFTQTKLYRKLLHKQNTNTHTTDGT